MENIKIEGDSIGQYVGAAFKRKWPHVNLN